MPAYLESSNLSCLRNKTNTKHDGQLPWIVHFFRQLSKKATLFGYRYWRLGKRWDQKTEIEKLVLNKMDWASINVRNNLRSIREYVVTTLDEICVPSEDERFECPGEESWDASTWTLANGLRHTIRRFGHIFCFVCAMDMLEPMRPLVSARQGHLEEVYFGFKKVEFLYRHSEWHRYVVRVGWIVWRATTC